jgi:demethylmenaquinone methyltransferase / 2-methoxy-6-polyprenyl-1,4-benzoquinol methylase
MEGSAESLPFPDSAVERVAISFGIRNVPDRGGALQEMHRVCAPGGKLAILELTEPRRGALALLARFHVRQVVPRLGAALSGSREYRYLQQSIAAFPPPEDFAGMMRRAGWRLGEPRPLAFGACHLFLAEKE